MLRRDALSLGLLLTAGGLTSVFPGATEAAAVVRPGLLVRGVRGTWKGRGNAHGSLIADILVQRLTVDRAFRTLRVHGRIKGLGGSGLAPFVSQPFVATAELTPALPGEGSCGGVLTLNIEAIDLSIRGGLVIDPAPIRLRLDGLPPQKQILGSLLCGLANLLTFRGPVSIGAFRTPRELLAAINRILAEGEITLPKS